METGYHIVQKIMENVSKSDFPMIYDDRAPSFCDCVFPQSNEVSGYQGDIHDHVICTCGEEDYHQKEWTWDKNSAHPECFIDGSNVTFHPIYSQGTSIIKGNKRLEPNCIHYWEMRTLTSLSGTDVMFGIGTDKVDLSQYNFQFVSALGLNEYSWGYSYRGFCQHNGELQQYGMKITKGCIVGVYLDLSKGYLEFFLNRESMGIAYRNIPTDENIKLFPMVCCTAAKSSIRLINSTSRKDSLQYRTMQELSKRPTQIQHLKQFPGTRNILNNYWFLCTEQRYSKSLKRNGLSLEDEALLPRKSTKVKFINKETNKVRYIDMLKLYPRSNRSSSEEEDVLLSDEECVVP